MFFSPLAFTLCMLYNVYEVIKMSVSEAQKKANKKYLNSGKSDRITIQASTARLAPIRAAAAALGMSLTAYILMCCERAAPTSLSDTD